MTANPKATVSLVLLATLLVLLQISARADSGEESGSDQDKKVAEETKILDLYTVTAFHQQLYSAICSDSHLYVWYRGPLARPRGRPTANGGIHPTLDNARFFLTWGVTETEKPAGPVLFYLSVSQEKRPDTVASCLVNKRKLYVSVRDITRGRTLDSPLTEVEEKGMTIRKLLARLEKR